MGKTRKSTPISKMAGDGTIHLAGKRLDSRDQQLLVQVAREKLEQNERKELDGVLAGKQKLSPALAARLLRLIAALLMQMPRK